jgi:hypothetical protein
MVNIPNNATSDEARRIITNLATRKWVDVCTAAVFVDVNVYNPNLDAITSIRLIAEFFPSGVVYTNVECMVAVIDSKEGFSSGKFKLKIFVLISLAVNMFRSLWHCVKKRVSFRVLYTWMCFAFVITWFVKQVQLLKEFPESLIFNAREYYPLRMVMTYEKHSRDVAGFAAFFLWLQLFFFLRHVIHR